MGIPDKPVKVLTPKLPVSDYVGNRIANAIEEGYSSTRAWIYQSEYAVLEKELKAKGYEVYVVAEDGPGRIQVVIDWH